MKLYCMCGGENYHVDRKDESGRTEGVVIGRAMDVTANGVKQYIKHPNTVYSRHYPNVDLRRCTNCGTEVCLEG